VVVLGLPDRRNLGLQQRLPLRDRRRGHAAKHPAHVAKSRWGRDPPAGPLLLLIRRGGAEMEEPRRIWWARPRKLCLLERPGGGGRSHRPDRRAQEIAYLADKGVWMVVSTMK